MKTKKKALFVSNIFPNRFEKNRGIYTYKTIKELNKLCELKIFAPYSWYPFKKIGASGTYCSSIPTKECFDGLEVCHPRYLYIPKISLSVNWLSYYYSLHKSFLKNHPLFKPDFILCSWIYPDGYASMNMARRLDVPFFVITHGSDVNSHIENRMIMSKIEEVARKADKMFFPSREMRNKIVSLVGEPEKMVIKPFGVDTSLFKIIDPQYAKKETGISASKKTILFVGNLEKVKGINYLIEAVSLINRNDLKSLRFIIVGDGSEKSELANLVSGKGLADSIEFVGAKKNAEIPLWINSSDIVCLPSLNEGCPNVIAESFACGVPVIASKVGEIPYLIREGTNGWMFSPKSPEEIKNAIMKSIAHPWKREEITETVKENSWENSAMAIYDEIVRNLSIKG